MSKKHATWSLPHFPKGGEFLSNYRWALFPDLRYGFMISKIILSPAFSLRVITVLSETIVTDQIKRLSTYLKSRVIWLVTDITAMTRTRDYPPYTVNLGLPSKNVYQWNKMSYHWHLVLLPHLVSKKLLPHCNNIQQSKFSSPFQTVTYLLHHSSDHNHN